LSDIGWKDVKAGCHKGERAPASAESAEGWATHSFRPHVSPIMGRLPKLSCRSSSLSPWPSHTIRLAGSVWRVFPVGTGRRLSSGRVASQPLGLDSLTLRGHSTNSNYLDNSIPRAIMRIDRRCSVPSYKPRVAPGAFALCGHFQITGRDAGGCRRWPPHGKTDGPTQAKPACVGHPPVSCLQVVGPCTQLSMRHRARGVPPDAPARAR